MMVSVRYSGFFSNGGSCGPTKTKGSFIKSGSDMQEIQPLIDAHMDFLIAHDRSISVSEIVEIKCH